jgi:spore cortex formation protein SpoVR/YcgB (stage V sporulation)
MIEPDIQIVDVDLLGDRQLRLRHHVRDGVSLIEGERDRVLHYLRRLWGYDIALEGIDAASGERLYAASTNRDKAETAG